MAVLEAEAAADTQPGKERTAAAQLGKERTAVAAAAAAAAQLGKERTAVVVAAAAAGRMLATRAGSRRRRSTATRTGRFRTAAGARAAPMVATQAVHGRARLMA